MKKASLQKMRIKTIFNKALELAQQGKRPNITGLMREAGYSEKSAKALKVTTTKTWQECLTLIDDSKLLKKLEDIALDTDKRASIEAIKEIFKLKDRYPKSKLSVEVMEQEISKIEE